MSNSQIPVVENYRQAEEYEAGLRLLWSMMIDGMTTILVTRRSDECLELFRWIFEAHRHALALHTFLCKQPIVDLEKTQKSLYFVSAFSALLETQYPFLVNKYRKMLSNSELLEVLNAKMAVQYAARVLGPDPIDQPRPIMA